jgi:hypothetical protein
MLYDLVPNELDYIIYTQCFTVEYLRANNMLPYF